MDNAVKMFNLSFLNVTGTPQEAYQASLVLQLTLQRVEELRPGAVYGR